ncbi:MAG: ATP-binding protein [Chloroflexota bacterium]|nr:ATP-binding protein [Chloroflexota bacterium]
MKAWVLPQLTLRVRLVLYTMALSLTLNLILVLFINALATALFPQAQIAFATLGLSIPAPDGSGPATPAGSAQPLLDQLRLISAFGLGLITVLTGAGAYWLAGRTLRTLRTVSRAAQQISAQTLDTRLALAGPPDEVTEIAAAFDGLLDRLERAFAQQGEFVADAAHELRTPLTTLRANLEVVSADPAATLADYRALAPVWERALTRLDQLVESLLILAAAPHGLASEPTSLQPLLRDVLDSLAALAAQYQVTLTLAPSPDVVLGADGTLLAHAFSNLIENGIRYNRLGGTVTVTSRRTTAAVVILVQDTGIGIAPQDQAHIFDRFYRVDRSRARHQGGAGLGLAIVEHIIKQHGGTIQVASVLGSGTTFTIRLPPPEAAVT